MKQLSNTELREKLILSEGEITNILNGKEVWKEIPGYKNYMISSKGRLYTKPQKITAIIRNKEVIINKKGRLNLGSAGVEANGSSYMRAFLRSDKNLLEDKRKYDCFYIHRLMVKIFFGQEENDKLVTDHRDDNKSNNDIRNLHSVTHRFNVTKSIGGKGSSSYVGVSWSEGAKSWRASIDYKGKTRFLGYFRKELSASKAYNAALKVIEAS